MKLFTQSNKSKKQVSKARKVINAVITSIIVVFFVFALSIMIYLIFQLVSGNSPSIFGYRFYFVLTDSMEPTLKPKDMILSKVIKDSSDIEYVKEMIHEGDVVTYIGKVGPMDAFITHRVIKGEDKDDVIYFDEDSNSWMIITKGDHNSRADDPIPITKLKAVMVRKVNIVSAIFNFASNPAGGFVLIFIPILFILIPFVFRLILAIKAPSEEEKKKELSEEEKKHLEDERKRLEEEIARKAVEEYLAEQSKEEDNSSPDNKE